MVLSASAYRADNTVAIKAMRIWTLVQTCTALGLETFTPESLTSASRLHNLLTGVEREALELVMDLQRGYAVGANGLDSPRINSHLYDGIKDKSAAILYLECLLSNYTSQFFIDNGFDPVLGEDFL